MPNVFKSAFNGAMDSIKSPLKVGKDLLHGDFKGAWTDLKHMPGNQERLNSQTLQSVGIRGWVGKHPTETAGIVAATIFGGWAASGAFASASGTAGAGAAGATGASTAGASALTYAPTASSVLGGSGVTTGASSLAYGGSIAGNAVAATGEGIGFSSSGAMTLATPTVGNAVGVAGQSGAALGSNVSGSAMAYNPTQSTALGGQGSGGYSSQNAFNNASKRQQQSQQNQQQQDQDKQDPLSYLHHSKMLDEMMSAENDNISQSRNQLQPSALLPSRNGALPTQGGI